jgi:hypothetical protein
MKQINLELRNKTKEVRTMSVDLDFFDKTVSEQDSILEAFWPDFVFVNVEGTWFNSSDEALNYLLGVNK